jgi:predicted Zn-dependent protease with MMP-like domain
MNTESWIRWARKGPMPRLEISPRRFEKIARKAIAGLPGEFQPFLRDVMLVVEPYAADELLDDLEVPEDEDLFGLYEGPSLAERSSADAPEMPPRVILFYEAFLDECETEDELLHEIQTTVLHEIGHHFGLDEERLAELGYE